MIIGIGNIPTVTVGKTGIKIKKSHQGLFTEYCGGEVTNECIQKAKKSKNSTLRKRATFAQNVRGWAKKHQEGGFVAPKISLTDEQKKLKETNPQEFSKLMPFLMRQSQRDYARAWYNERVKNPKYQGQLQGNMDKINNLLDQDGYVSNDDVSTKLGGKKAVSETGQPLLGGFVSGNLSVDGNPFWFGKSKGSWWHEGIGHWLGDQIPGLLTKYPATWMKYTGPFPDDAYQNYINQQNENHAQTWEFRGLNKDLKDANGNLYIDPNRQLTPEDVEEMQKNPRFKMPENWQNTNIDAKGIADFHNTFAFNGKSNTIQMAKDGTKVNTPTKPSRNWDNTLTGRLINYSENPDSIGWDAKNRRWYAPPAGKGYDTNQFGMGVDRNYTQGFKERVKKDRKGREYLTEQDERYLRHRAIDKANESANTRYRHAQKASKIKGAVSPKHDAITVSAIYNLGPGHMARTIFENPKAMKAIFNRNSSEYQKYIHNQYKLKGRNERIQNELKFFKQNGL